MISNFKTYAKESLKGNWGNAIIVFLGIYFLGSFISSVPQYFVMPAFMSQLMVLENPDTLTLNDIFIMMGSLFAVVFITQLLITVFVVGILQLGYSRFSIKLARTDQADTETIFDGFKMHYFLNVKSVFIVGIYSLLWMAPYLGFLFGGIYFASIENSLYILMFILSAVTFIFAYAKILNYSFVNLLLMDDEVEFGTAREYITESKRLMNGHRWQLVVLGLSFILWMFAIMFTFGLAILYVGPYMQQTITNFYNHVKETKNIAYE